MRAYVCFWRQAKVTCLSEDCFIIFFNTMKFAIQ